jgi:hypothetical protein
MLREELPAMVGLNSVMEKKIMANLPKQNSSTSDSP